MTDREQLLIEQLLRDADRWERQESATDSEWSRGSSAATQVCGQLLRVRVEAMYPEVLEGVGR